uniref:S100/CaBP-9k-type calcium binding subdomain domain-containing protein n=1 Tax=Zonotrichia albicollis TaxID=44394 RepID=A0A8D2MY02_ZONAL
SMWNCTLEKALQTVVDLFHQYSIRQGEIDLLSMNDFTTLLKEQAPSFLQTCVSARGTNPWGWGSGAPGGRGVSVTPSLGSPLQFVVVGSESDRHCPNCNLKFFWFLQCPIQRFHVCGAGK